MIVLNLACAAGHHFEGWFASAEAYERQAGEGLVNCPSCGDGTITRLPAGPHLVRASRPAPVATQADAAAALQALQALIDGAENVGSQFPEEARRIHYRESPARSIRGTASAQDTLDLLEEGIAVVPLLLPPKDEPLN